MADTSFEEFMSIGGGSSNKQSSHKLDGEVKEFDVELDESHIEQWGATPPQPSKSVTSTKERIRNISQKLTKLKSGLEADKYRNRFVMEGKVQELEAFIKKTAVEDQSMRLDYQKRLQNLMESIEQERLARELLDERKSKEAIVLEKQIQLQFQAFKQETLETQQETTEKLDHIAKYVDNDRQARRDTEQKLGIQLSEQVSCLLEEVERAKSERQAMAEEMKTLKAALTDTEKRLDRETKEKEHLKQYVGKFAKELLARTQAEISTEKKEREAMEETMLKLIEQTCSQVEASLSVDN